MVYDESGTDECSDAIRLEDDDERTLIELLGGSEVTEGLTELQNVEGLAIDWLHVRQGSACVGSPIGHIDIDGNVTIVAVVRRDRTFPSPAADFVLWPGDTAVAVGTPDGIERAFTMLQGE